VYEGLKMISFVMRTKIGEMLLKSGFEIKFKDTQYRNFKYNGYEENNNGVYIKIYYEDVWLKAPSTIDAAANSILTRFRTVQDENIYTTPCFYIYVPAEDHKLIIPFIDEYYRMKSAILNGDKQKRDAEDEEEFRRLKNLIKSDIFSN
jgi:hypothetical protein